MSKIIQKINILSKSRFLGNASWIIFGKVIQVTLGLVISMFTARYLGPSNYGLINYASAFSAFFAAFCTLGINGIIVKELLDHPKEQGSIIGSSILLRLISSTLSMLMIVLIVSLLNPNDHLVVVVTALSSLNLIFQAFDTIIYWYQSRLMSKISTIISIISYLLISVYKILLLATGKSIQWFAAVGSLDYFLIAVMLLISYRRNGGQKLQADYKVAKSILFKSYHFILSGLAVAISGQISSILLKHWLDDAAVGYYGISVTLCGMWAFILSAIIDSARPVIMENKKKNEALYKKRIVQLYSFIIYISFIVSILFSTLGEYIIIILYGSEFLPATSVLRILTWYTAFSYLGVARSIWIVSEQKYHYEKVLAFAGAICSLIMNFVFIPWLGVRGAAIASLLTQILANFLIPMLIPAVKENSLMIVQAFNPKYLKI